MNLSAVDEDIVYKIGDKVLYRKIAQLGQIWTIKKINHKAKRCTVQRSTPDRMFERTVGFKFIILEVNLARRIRLDIKKPISVQQKDNSLVLTFERVASILKLIYHNPNIDNAFIRQALMPDLSVRTVQRHTDALLKEGYLDREIDGAKRQCFCVTNKAIQMLDIKECSIEHNVHI